MIKEKIGSLIKNSFSKCIIELKLAADRLCVGKGNSAGVFTVKYQMLYLIASNGQTSPQELIQELNMAKSNLALLAKKMISEGLIVRIKERDNKKQIYYIATEKGINELAEKMEAIEKIYNNEKEMLMHLTKTVQTLKKIK